MVISSKRPGKNEPEDFPGSEPPGPPTAQPNSRTAQGSKEGEKDQPSSLGGLSSWNRLGTTNGRQGEQPGTPSVRTGPASSLRASPNRSGHEVIFADPDGVVAILADCVLIVHFETPTRATLGAMHDAYSKAVKRSGKFAHLCVIERDAPLLPPGDVRSAMEGLMRRFDKSIAGAALIFEGTGFKATTMRSIVTGLCVASRTTHRTRVFAEVPPACAWIGSCLPPKVGSFELQLSAAVRELRAGRQRADRPGK